MKMAGRRFLSCLIYESELTSYEDSYWQSIIKREEKKERNNKPFFNSVFRTDVSDIHFLPRGRTYTHTPVLDRYSSS